MRLDCHDFCDTRSAQYVVLRQPESNDAIVFGYTDQVTVVPKRMQVSQRFADRKAELGLDFMLVQAWRALQYRKRFDVNVNGRRGL